MGMNVRGLMVCWIAWNIVGALSAAAEVTRVEITTKTPWLGGRALGRAGPYEKLQGRIYFEVDPESPASRRIADIGLAPRNAKGRVEFSSDFVLVRPRDAARARHSILLEIPNRGLTQANGSFFFAASGSAFDLMNLDVTSLSDAFLFEQGFTVAWLGWQFDLPEGAIRMDAPSANVSGAVRQSIIATFPGGHLARLGGSNSYCAADAVQPDAQLAAKAHFDDQGRVLPRASWAFARIGNGKLIPDPCAVFSRDEFEPGQLYELTYQGAHPPLAGLGEAAVRDFVSWIKFGGVESPLREHPETVSRVLGYGYSQSGRFLRDFLYRGFNADERGRQAFDGLFIASAGGGRGSFDHRYAMPGEAGNSVLSDLRPVDLFPFSDGIEEDPVTGARDGSSATGGIIAHRAENLLHLQLHGVLGASGFARLYNGGWHTGTAFERGGTALFFPGTPHSHYPFPPIKTARHLRRLRQFRQCRLVVSGASARSGRMGRQRDQAAGFGVCASQSRSGEPRASGVSQNSGRRVPAIHAA